MTDDLLDQVMHLTLKIEDAGRLEEYREHLVLDEHGIGSYRWTLTETIEQVVVHWSGRPSPTPVMGTFPPESPGVPIPAKVSKGECKLTGPRGAAGGHLAAYHGTLQPEPRHTAQIAAGPCGEAAANEYDRRLDRGGRR